MSGMTILSTWNTLEGIRHSILTEDLGAVMNVAGLLACIGAGTAVFKVVKTYMTGTNMDPWDLFKPIILMLLVCNFDTLVLGPVNGLCGIIARETARLVDVNPNSYLSEWSSLMIEMGTKVEMQNYEEYRQELLEISESSSVVGAFFSKVGLAVKKLLMYIFNVKTLTLGGIVGGILFLIVKMLLFAQQGLSCMYLLVNSLLGPYVLALGIMPGFESGFKNWLGRQLQLSMWVPIGYLIMGLNLALTERFVLTAGSGSGLGTEWLMIVMQIIALVSVASVPKMSTWLIHTLGSNDAHSTITNMAKKAAKV